MSKKLIFIFIFLYPNFAICEYASLLVYKVWEKGSPSYITRILVTDKYVRLDDGADGGDFTLFDRKNESVYNISVKERAVLTIEPIGKKIPENNILILDEKKSSDPSAPMISGKKPFRIDFLANGELCGSVIAVSDLMENALIALREFRLVLARVHADTQATQPDILQTACDLASNIHAPTRTLDYGLPIEEFRGENIQLLLDLKEKFEVESSMFVIPSNLNV